MSRREVSSLVLAVAALCTPLAAHADPPTASFGPVEAPAPAGAPEAPVAGAAPPAATTPNGAWDAAPAAFLTAEPTAPSPSASTASGAAAYAAAQQPSHVGSFPVDPPPEQRGFSTTASPPPYGWQPYHAQMYRGPADAPAAPEEESQTGNPWILSLEGATNIPLDVGARASLETPKGFRLATSFGVIPSAFAGVVNRLTERFDERVQLGPGDGYTNGTAWRTQIGFRPSKRIGLYLDGGYSRVRLLGRFAFSAVTSRYPDAGFDLDTRLHNWLFELGYQTQVQDHWVLAIGAGVQGTIASNSEAEGYGTTPRESVQEIAEEAVEKFDRRFEKYGYMPTLTLRVGYDLL